MNFLYKSGKFRIIFFCIWLITWFNSHTLSAQYQEIGLPFTEQVIPPDFTLISGFNSITQDSLGFLYLGGYHGILRYDGLNWQQLLLNGQIYLVSDRDGTVFAGGENLFGKINYMPDGSIGFINVLSSLPEDRLSIGKVINLASIDQKIYLLADSGLFKWDDSSLMELTLPDDPDLIISFNDSLIISTKNNRLITISEDKPDYPKSYKSPLTLKITNLLVWQDTLLIISEKGELYSWQNGITKQYHLPIERSCNPDQYSNGLALADGSFIMGTKNNGIFVHNADLKTPSILNQSTGLFDNAINQIFADHSGNLWILHHNALTRIEWPSAYSYFDNRQGLTGHINSLLQYKGRLYATSTHGLFMLSNSLSCSLPENICCFKKIKGIDEECHQLLSTPNSLLVSGTSGIFQVLDNIAVPILPTPVNILYQSPAFNNIVLAGTHSGILILNDQNGQWIFTQLVGTTRISIYDMAISSDKYLWISTLNNEIYKASLDHGIKTDLQFIKQIPGKDIPPGNEPVEFFETDDRLLFSTSTALYHYNPELQQVIPFSGLKFPETTCEKSWIKVYLQDHNKNLWIKSYDPVSKNCTLWVAQEMGENSYESCIFNNRRLNPYLIHGIYEDLNNNIWFYSNNLLIRYDESFKPLNTPHFVTFITSIAIHVDSVMRLAHGLIPAKRTGDIARLKIPFSKNNIRFDFQSTDLSSGKNRVYQFILYGYHKDWSDWNINPYANFISLPRGKYVFEVRGQDITGQISKPDVFRFTILPPFYLSWWAIIIYCFLVFIALYFYLKWRTFHHLEEKYKLEEIIQERTEALIKEKEKSENLLANILPKKTADELKLKGKATSSKFKMVTVLFSDIQGFTKIAEQMNPDKLIDELDRLYFQFDSVVEKYNIEKIKTIGDAFMAAGGIPIKNRTNPVEVVLAALEMQQYMKELKKTKTDIWDLRIGIHTGSVIAGVVGQKKFSYDIWGDTVNTASRMESSGEPGRVNISTTTYEFVKKFFDCEYRGKMPVKYKGDIEMYFVNGLVPELRAENEVTPNEIFNFNLQLLRLLDLEEYIVQKLEQELPETLYYHNVEHTLHVYTQAELLGRSEGLTSSDLLLLRTAALFHDIGYINSFEDHEVKSVDLARETLPLYRYAEDQIDNICNLILATKMPPDPKNLLEKIICDANLDHLGRVDFLIQSDKLFQEYRIRNKFKSKKEWNEFQIDFLKKHEFFTEAARKLREVSQEQQIENIRTYS